MAGALIQPAILSAVVSKSNSRLHGTEKIRKTATMICNVGSHPSKTEAFTSRLESFTARCSHDLHSVFEEERDRQGLVAAVFEHFTDEAIEVTRLAEEEARRLGHNFIGTEHILLALMSEGTGIAAQVLGINLKLNDARVEVERMTGRGSEFVGEEMHFTPCAKRVFELSIEEADKLCPLFELVHTIKGKYIKSEHLLLGLLSEGDGAASRLLENLGADPSNIRREVFALILEEADSSHVDRFLPDKAIDLIDEASSRVQLRHAQLPEEARELDKEV